LVTEFLFRPKFSRAVFNGELMGAIQARQSAALGLQDGFMKLDNHLYRTDARFVWGGPMDYATLAVSDVRNWMETPMSSGYVEVSLVGDIPEQVAADSVARTLGSLPQRAEEKKTGYVRPVTVAARPEFQRVEFVGEAYQAVAVGIWPIEEKLTFEEEVNLSVLNRILEVRIRNEVREEQGLAYAPRSEYRKFPEYKKYAMIQAMVDCSPDNAESIAKTIERIGTTLAEEGVTQEEFEGAVEPYVGHVRQALVTNSFLLGGVLVTAQEKPESLEKAIALKSGLDDVIRREEVERLGKKILARDNTRTVAIVPKPFVGVFQIEEGGSAGEAVIGRP
jgi:zinc protease